MSNDGSTEKRMIKLTGIVIIMSLFNPMDSHAKLSDQHWQTAFNKHTFVMPNSTELKQVNKAYQMELMGQPANDLWQALSIQTIRQKDLLYLQEAKNKHLGRGVFALRSGNNRQPWLLQAPHAKSDLYTGKIAAKLFAEGNFKGVMWNTVSRKTLVDNDLFSTKADMAHLPNTYWQAITERFAKQYKEGKIIQIHGYAQSKRKSVAARNSDIIISAGHQRPPIWVQQFTECLKKALPYKISLYPYDVKELGATTNVQVKLLLNLDFNGFVHIELTKPVRKHLLNSLKIRQTLLTCLK